MLTEVALAVLRPRFRAIQLMDQGLPEALSETHALLRRAFREEGLDPAVLGSDLNDFRRRFHPSTKEGPGPRWVGEGPPRWARTSGGYRVPWTHAHSRSFSEFQKDVAAALVVGRGLGELADGPALIAQAGWEIETGPDGVVEGYSLALAALEAAWWVKRKMRPSLEELRAPTVEGRLAAAREALVRGRIRAISGIPSYTLAMVALLGADPDAARALRQVTAYVWSGMPLAPGQAELAAYLSPKLRLADFASSTEGPLGLPGEEAGVYRLAARNALHLFVPERGEPRLGHELEAGETYRVWLTASAGLVHWDTGDHIRVRSARPLRFSYLPSDPDPARLGEALGTPWFRLYLGSSPGFLVEGDVDVRPVQDALPANTKLLRLPPGTLARATLRLGLRGVPKVPWVYADPELHRRVLDAVA